MSWSRRCNVISAGNQVSVALTVTSAAGYVHTGFQESPTRVQIMVQFRILLILPWARASLKGFYAIGIHVPRIGSAVVKDGSVALVPLKSRAKTSLPLRVGKRPGCEVRANPAECTPFLEA